MKGSHYTSLAALTVALALPLAEASAQNMQPVQGNSNLNRSSGRSVYSLWSLDVSANYSDNFSRVADADYERRFVVDGETFASMPIIEEGPNGPFIADVVPIADTVALGPVAKSFGTVTFSGTTLFERPSTRGIVTGGVRVGHYFDGSSYVEEVEDELNANLPEELDDFESDDIVPTAGFNDGFEQTFIDPNISGLTQLDLVGERLYLEVGGFVTEQNFGGRNGQIQEIAGQGQNEIILGGFYVSPVSFWRLPQEQAVELRASHSSVQTLGDTLDDVVATNVQQVGDSVSNEVELGYNSGDVLSLVTLSLGATARQFEEESDKTDFSQDFEQLSVFGGLGYDINSKLTLTLRVGYDEATIESQPVTPAPTPSDPDPATPDVLEDDLSGTFYTVGFNWRPSRVLSLSASGGERFQGFQYQAQASWRLTPRLTFTAGANRQVTSGAQEVQDRTVNLNSQSLALLDSFKQTGDTFEDRTLQNSGGTGSALQSGSGLNGIRVTTVANATLSGVYGRNNFALNVNASIPEAAEDDETGQALGVAINERYTAQFQFGRQVQRRLRVTAQAQALFQFADDNVSFDAEDPSAVSGQFTQDVIEQLYGLNAVYQFNRDLSVSASYNHLRRTTDQPDELSLFRGTPFEYQENQLRIGARLNF